MVKYILKRLGISLTIILGVLSLTFILVHLAPGDPSSLYLRPEIDSRTVENIRRQMGLDLPLWRQYFIWLREFITGNFGVSFAHHRPVSELLAEAIPNTLKLTVAAYVGQLIAGIVLGVLTAVKRGSKLDHAISSVLLFLYSMPGFWLGLMAILLFSLKLGWLPSSQMHSITITGGFRAEFVDFIKHL
ncbi:MAG: ABC transporter permease, partial [bacterium]